MAILMSRFFGKFQESWEGSEVPGPMKQVLVDGSVVREGKSRKEHAKELLHDF